MTSIGAAPTPSSPIPRSTWLALAGILALALAIRVAGLNYSLWYDEIASTRFAATPLRLLWSDWMMRETNPPLYYSLLGGWAAVFGDGDVALRSLSVAIGLIGVAFAFLLGRQVGGDRAGLIAAALLALSAQHVMYSQQVRGYVLGHAAALAALYAALNFLAARDDPPGLRRTRALAGYAVAVLVALYSHTMLMLLPALTGAFVVVRLAQGGGRSRRALAEWMAANVLVLLAWAWWARLTLVQATARRTIGWIEPPSLPYALRMTLENGLPWGIGPVQYVVALLALGIAGWTAWRWRRTPDRLLLVVVATGTPMLLFLLSRRVPVFLDRTVWWSSGPLLVTVAAGMASIRSGAAWAAIGAATAVSIGGWLSWFPAREIEPWRAVAGSVQRQAPDAAVLVRGKGPLFALRRYCRPPACTLTIVGLADQATDSWATGFPVAGLGNADAGAALLAARGRLVAVRWLDQDPMAPPPPGATAERLAGPVVRDDNIAATLWTTRR